MTCMQQFESNVKYSKSQSPYILTSSEQFEWSLLKWSAKFKSPIKNILSFKFNSSIISSTDYISVINTVIAAVVCSI